jgi:hypothetical protein
MPLSVIISMIKTTEASRKQTALEFGPRLRHNYTRIILPLGDKAYLIYIFNAI